MCDFCKTFDFSSASWDVTKYGSHIKMAECQNEMVSRIMGN